jgi:hypothetical protein
MTIRKLCLLMLAAMVGVSVQGQSRSLELIPAASSDLRAASLVAAPDMELANTSREPVSFTWDAADTPAAKHHAPFAASSRSYGLNVSAAELARGVTLKLDAPGAVIRVSGQRVGQTIAPDKLLIALPSGRELSARAATDQLVQRQDLGAATGGIAGQGLGVRLARELGAGAFTLRYPAERPDDQVRIEVFDRNSDKVLVLQSAADHFMQPEDARVQTDWRGASRVSKRSGFALAPDGTQHALIFAADGSAGLASATRAQYQTGLWEWHVQTTDTDGVRREVKTAFALTAAVARLDNSARVVIEPDSVSVALGAQVQSAGRYELRATLLATNTDGKLVPALTSATARWLEPGQDALSLQFDAGRIKALGLAAPFALRNVSLLDQSRMGTLERRREALTF